MNNKPRYTKGTMRNQIVQLMHVSSVMTSRSYKLFDRPQHMANVMVLLRKEGVVERLRCPEICEILSLQNYSENLDEYFYDNIPEEEIEYFEQYGKVDVRKAKYLKDESVSRSARIIKNGEIILLMCSSGIPTLPSEKKHIVQNKRLTDNVYYQSREIKYYAGYTDDIEESESGKAVIATRINGTLLTAGGNYNIYHIGKDIQTWSAPGEYKIKNFIQNMLANYINMDSYMLDSAILFSYDLSLFQKFIEPTQKLRARYEGLQLTYSNIYILPYDKNGREMIKIMSSKDWIYRINYEVMGEVPKDTHMLDVTCDYYDGEIYTFVFCVPNMARYIEFISKARLVNDKERFQVMCFDFQVEFVAKSASRYANIYTASFNEFAEEWFGAK